MEPNSKRLDCRVDFCPSGRWYPDGTAPSQFVCLRHRSLAEASAEFIVIGDPQSGEDKYLYSGVEYSVRFRTPRIRGQFVGVLSPVQTQPWRVTFQGEGFHNEIDLSLDVITDIVAV